MKRKIKFLKLVFFIFIVLINATACGMIDKNDDLIDFTNDLSTSKSIEVSDNSNLESVEYTEKQIVEAICIELYGFNDNDALKHADYILNIAETISERVLGNIISEEDAIEKARDVLIEYVGVKYIEMIESDFVEINGEYIKYERTKPPYEVIFYEEYDVWLIQTILPSGITEDGRKVGAPGMPPYIIIRASDGKVLAVFN